MLKPCIETMEQRWIDTEDQFISEVERRSLIGQLSGLDRRTGCFPCSCCTDHTLQPTPRIEPDPIKNKCVDCGTFMKGSTEARVVINRRACVECCKYLKQNKLPRKALINGTWQGALPPDFRMKSYDNPDGFTEVEASMIAINLCITRTTIMPSGTEFIHAKRSLLFLRAVCRKPRKRYTLLVVVLYK